MTKLKTMVSKTPRRTDYLALLPLGLSSFADCLEKSTGTYISTMTVSNMRNGFGTCMNILVWTMMQPMS